MLSVTLRQLEYAVAVWRHQSVSQAAQALNVSQPALSVAIGQLEAQLGHPLFLRKSGGPMLPTGFGRGFLEDAERQLAQLARLTARGGQSQTPVILGIFEDLAPLALAPLLRLMGALEPDLICQPRVDGFEGLAQGLAQGRIDMAVTYDLGLDASVARLELVRLLPHAVLDPAHPLAGQKAVTLRELTGVPLVLADQGLSIRHMRALFTHAGLSPNILHRAASLELMRSMAANGLGVGISYTCPIPDRSYDGKPLVTRRISDAGAGEAVVLARQNGNPLSEEAERAWALIETARGLFPVV